MKTPSALFALVFVLLGTAETAGADNLRVFIDCRHWLCNQTYLRSELTFVDHVRDRHDAQVQVMVTAQSTGGGGYRFEVSFLGQGSFEGQEQRLFHVTEPSASDDTVRSALLRLMRLGLVPFVANTDAAQHLDVVYKPPDGDPPAEPAEDPWDYWVFRLGFNMSLSGQQTTNYMWLNGSVSADRVTEDWKINIDGSANYDEDNFTYPDGEQIKSISRSYSSSVLVAASLNEHWSAGAWTGASSSTYSNVKAAAWLAPAVEYDLFPYSEFAKRKLTVRYYFEPKFRLYAEETLFDKTEQLLFRQELTFALSLTQPWGEVWGSLSGSHYLHDVSKNNVSLDGGISLNLFKGLGLNLSGSVSRVRDQLSLPKGAADVDEVLLRRQELATDFTYWLSFGFSYTFGSIYNGVVNPRF